jgi:alpha-2-macroglobulin
MSTQTTAYCLLSMAKFAGNATSKEIKFTYKLDDGKLVNVATTKTIAEIKLSTGKKAMKGNINMNNQGQGILFVRVISEGIPEAGLEKEFSNNLSLSVSYRTLAGDVLDVSKIEQGTDFLAVVTIYNPQSFYYKDMALSQIFPSGWEIHNTRLSDFESAYSMSEPTYQDIRDDRVYTYFDLGVRSSKTFVVQLNAAYLGKYYLPGVYCEAMYDNSISALAGGKWIEVIYPGN